MADQSDKEAVAPEGWEETVKKMKKHPEIDNPWALAWYMKNKGATPGGKEASEFAQAAIKYASDTAVAEFKAEVMSTNVAIRFAKTFPSQEALNKYLQKHPKADARDHKVERPQDKSDEDKSLDDLKSRARHNKRREKKLKQEIQDGINN